MRRASRPEGHEHQHYVPRFILRNFVSDGSGRVNFIYLSDDTPMSRKASRVFQRRRLYDVPGPDVLSLENAFGTEAENPMKQILDDIVRQSDSGDVIRLKHSDLKTVKRYLLAQRYRTPFDEHDFRASCSSDDHSEDGWKGRLSELIGSEWNDLLRSDDDELRMNVLQTTRSFLMFVRTVDDEFIMNNLGTASELCNIPEECQRRLYEASIRSITGHAPKVIPSAIGTGGRLYINYFVFPLTPELAVLQVDPVWKTALNGADLFGLGLHSRFLQCNLSLPGMEYADRRAYRYSDLMHDGSVAEEEREEALKGYLSCLSDDDVYLYDVHRLSSYDAALLNRHLLNSGESICYHDPEKILLSLEMYRDGILGEPEHDLAGFTDRIEREVCGKNRDPAI